MAITSRARRAASRGCIVRGRALRRRLERQDVGHVWRVKAIPFTVSIGVATREAGERDVDALMRRADRALHHAKAAGRNRVEVR
ncbi:hypothetical protein BG57_32645 [Caballeronia grimmiae]|uniref:diguanylate cyclase n=1 Tax=Caballeronia grimmiae TaxID=1071679 RepID=A0A069P3L5_9BURK|nr:hypothetical protein BG57_32645 [Caballeronia grimmiae]GGD88974.1 hypothetical protein GCM10010985_49480 [Caballeronia grimmiae]